MRKSLSLFYIRKIPKVDLKQMEGKDICDIEQMARNQGYGFLYFPEFVFANNTSGFKDLKPYMSEPIKVNYDYIIDEEKVKKDYNAPKYCLNCIDQENDVDGTLFVFMVAPPNQQPTEFTVYISNKKVKEKYLIETYDEIRCVYTHFMDTWHGDLVDNLLLGKEKTNNTLYFYQLSKTMFNYAMSLVGNDYELAYINNTREGLFYQLTQDS